MWMGVTWVVLPEGLHVSEAAKVPGPTEHCWPDHAQRAAMNAARSLHVCGAGKMPGPPGKPLRLVMPAGRRLSPPGRQPTLDLKRLGAPVAGIKRTKGGRREKVWRNKSELAGPDFFSARSTTVVAIASRA